MGNGKVGGTPGGHRDVRIGHGYRYAVVIGRNLRSEDGENPEYDRALVEFIMDYFGVERAAVAADLGLDLGYLYGDRGVGVRDEPWA